MGNFRLFKLFFVLLFTMGAGCATVEKGYASTKDSKTIWKFRDQYVRLEPQGTAGESSPFNDHPADFSADRLRQALIQIEIRPQGEDKAIPLFTSEEVKTLCGPLATGLAQAKSQEDVTFAVIGMHRGSFMPERRLTTGRAFSLDGKLILVLGEPHAPFDEEADRRLHPFVPPARRQSAALKWQVAEKPGIRPFSDGANPQPGWLELDLEKISQSAPSESPARREEPSNAGRPQGVTPPAGADDPVARLRILHQLRQESLITEEEYREKKREILEEL